MQYEKELSLSQLVRVITPPTTPIRILLKVNLGAYFSLLMKNHLVLPRLGLIFFICSVKGSGQLLIDPTMHPYSTIFQFAFVKIKR
jgi:hypothetical protein